MRLPPTFLPFVALYFALLVAAFPQALNAQGLATPSGGASRTPGFLTAPAPGDALDRVLSYVRQNRTALGLQQADLEDVKVTNRYTTQHNRVTHIYLSQHLAGIEVIGGYLNASVMPDGRLFSLHNRFVPGLALAVNTQAPVLSPIQAVELAAGQLGLSVTKPLAQQAVRGGPAREVLLSDGGISIDPIPVKLMYHTNGEGAVRLVWNLFVRQLDQQHWWNVNVDAVTGAVLSKTDWILQDSYRVFPAPLQNPDEGPHSLEGDPADATASQYGWHDDNGAAGAEFTDTRGNNVWAQEDADANNSGGFRPAGGAALVFDFALDLSQPPASSQSAAITNLFHWNNILHDIHYRYGFDEASGNYQANNYGAGGAPGDPVLADALDGSGFNNANFSRAPDGSSSRMQMFLFQFPGVTLHSPEAIAESIRGGKAQFGPALTLGGVTGDVVQALDPADPDLFSTTDGCSALTNAAAMAGNIALIDRGDCTFVQKVANAQAAGAIAAIIVNNAGDEVILMGGSDPTLAIPSIFIGQTHGGAIKAQLGSGVNATLSSQVQRDGDFDNGIIIHEYGHGVSTRLSGGPANAGCLSLAQSAGMGEGWSDWWALALTDKVSSSGTDIRPIGNYAQGEGPNGPGIRNFPYSTDLSVNPQTFAAVDGTNQPHGVGEIWAQAIWEAYWNLRNAYGFDPDLYTGSGGNNVMLQLVMDGLKLQGCEPTFLEARDAILQADVVNNAGANQCLLWQAFAKRGMGVNADDTGNPRRLKVTEDFTVPLECVPRCGNSTVEAGEQCDDGNTADGDCCSATCQFESVSTVCRSSAGVCDAAEFCDGVSGACPSDAKLTGECRAAVGSCDTAEVCDGVTDECPLDEVLDGVSCLDGDVCNGSEICEAGTCMSGTPLICDDGDECTAESCDEIAGCVHTPIESCTEVDVPTTSSWGQGFLIALLAGVGALLAVQRRRPLA